MYQKIQTLKQSVQINISNICVWMEWEILVFGVSFFLVNIT